jgi:hypothetical protein
LTSGRRPVVKIVAESLSQYYEKHVVWNPLSGIREEKKKSLFIYTQQLHPTQNNQ